MKKNYILCLLIFVILFSACILQKDGNKEAECCDCPQYAHPHPDWCKDGTIIYGEKNECGCQMPPKCEKKE
ncbi:MAG: hypothetical protein GYA51_10300 [Candidatus Methanofastidiosa archaeon]|nr:hypothetical protein [Candidatus Methanofastidiosa archaeon]